MISTLCFPSCEQLNPQNPPPDDILYLQTGMVLPPNLLVHDPGVRVDSRGKGYGCTGVRVEFSASEPLRVMTAGAYCHC